MTRATASALVLLPLLGCPKPAPAPTGAATSELSVQPSRASVGLDGWFLMQTDGRWWWTEIPADPELVGDLAPRAAPTAPPEAPDPALARAFLGQTGWASRPTAWAFTPADQASPLIRRAPELVAVEPVARPNGQVVLRAWLRPLDDRPLTLAVTTGSSDGPAPEGLRPDWPDGRAPRCEALGIEPLPLPARADDVPTGAPTCATLPVVDGQLVATETLLRPAGASPQAPPTTSCTAAALRWNHGGTRWIAPTCRSAAKDGPWDPASGPSLPLAWFRKSDGVPLVVLNRFHGADTTRCLATVPAVDRPFEATGCVGGS